MSTRIPEEGSLNPNSPHTDFPGISSTTRALWILFWSCVGLALLEVICGSLGYNPLLIIDGLVSAAFSIVATTILFGINMSRTENISRRYSYGKGKAHFLVSIMSGILFGIGGLLVLGFSIKQFFRPVVFDSTAVGFTISLLAVFIKAILYFYIKNVNSSSVDLHHKRLGRLLALSLGSSVAVVQSYVLIIFGWYLGERIGRISISFILLSMSVLLINYSLDGIMDRRMGKTFERTIEQLVHSVERVTRVESVRTRRIGENVAVDILAALNRECTIQDSDEVANDIRRVLSNRIQQPLRSINVEFCVSG